MVKQIVLSDQVHVALYDEEDAHLVEPYRWHYNQEGYAYYWVHGTQYRDALMMHRVICPTDLPIVHHKDNNGLNNTRANLEPMTVMQHQRLMRKAPGVYTSDLKGVHWEASRNKWKAVIMVEHKSIFLGRFDTEEEAYAARLGAERVYFDR